MKVRKWFCNPLIFHNILLASQVRKCSQVILQVIEKQQEVTCVKVRKCIPPYPPSALACALEGAPASAGS